MSTEENKEVERRIVEEVYNNKDMAPTEELIAPNWLYHGTDGQEFRGPEGFKQFVTMGITAFPDCRVTIEDLIAEGDRVVDRFTFRGTHRGDFMGIAPTGKQVEFSGIVICRFEGGKEVEVWEVNDQFGMMQQLGVIPG